MPARDFLPRDFSALPADGDDEAIIGRGPNILLRDRAARLDERRLRLDAPVGRNRPNRPGDVAAVETLLRQTGDLAFRPSSEPTGLFSVGLDNATRRFQWRRGLSDDGIVNPDGETFEALEDEVLTGEGADEHQQEARCVQLRVRLDNLQIQIERQNSRVEDADERVRQLGTEAEQLLAVHDAQIVAAVGLAILPGLNAIRLGMTVLAALRRFVRSLGDSAGSIHDAGEQAQDMIARLQEAVDELRARLAELDDMLGKKRALATRRRELGCT